MTRTKKIAKSLKEKNAMESNKRARKKYDKENFKYQSILFKIEELEELDFEKEQIITTKKN